MRSRPFASKQRPRNSPALLSHPFTAPIHPVSPRVRC